MRTVGQKKLRIYDVDSKNNSHIYKQKLADIIDGLLSIQKESEALKDSELMVINDKYAASSLSQVIGLPDSEKDIEYREAYDEVLEKYEDKPRLLKEAIDSIENTSMWITKFLT
jgi:hypothetical protein